MKQTWNAGFDKNGRQTFAAGSQASPERSIPVFPSLVGGTNFQSPSYDPATGWLILEYQEAGQRYYVTPQEYTAGKQCQGGRQVRVAEEPATAGIRALNSETGKVEWETRINRGSLNNGLIATGGGIVFASSADGNLLVLDSKTRTLLRSIKLANGMASAPMSYAVNGKQFVGVMRKHTVQLVAAGLTQSLTCSSRKNCRLLPTERPAGLSVESFTRAAACVTGFSMARVAEPPPSIFRAFATA